MEVAQARNRFTSLRIQFFIFAIALVVRLILVSRYPTTPVNDLLWNDAVGWNLAQGNGFTASHSEPRVPGIFRTPGYPFFLAAVYTLFGHSYTTVYIAQSLLDAFTAVLVGRLAVYYFVPALATLASLLYALYPYPAIFCGVLHQDILLVFCTLLTILILSKAIQSSRVLHWGSVGLLLGLTALVKINFYLLLILPAAAILFYFDSRRILRLILVTGGMVLMLSPWILRNYLVFHTFPTLSAGPITNLHLLVVELEGGAKAVHDVGMATPASDIKDFADGKELIDLEKMKTQNTLQTIRKHWLQYSALVLKHIPRLWITGSARWHSSLALIGNILSWIVLSFGIAGMILVRKRWRELMPLYLTVILITLMYAPFIIEARYTLPARPVMLCFVSCALVALLRKAGVVSSTFPSLTCEYATEKFIQQKQRTD